MNSRASVLAFLSVAAAPAVLLGCPDKPKADGSGAATVQSAMPAPSSSAAKSGLAQALASASAGSNANGPCQIQSTTKVSGGARQDTGLTVVRFTPTQTAVGFAVGGGTPKVALVDGAGNVNVVEPDWSHVRDQEPLKPKMYRAIMRVTPIGYVSGKMRVGMDIKDTPTDKTMTDYNVRCGPADTEPVVGDSTPLNFDPAKITEDDVAKMQFGPDGESDIRDCRSFANGESEQWVLATEVRRHGKDADHKLAVDWIIDNVPGKVAVTDPIIHSSGIEPKDKKYPPLDHYLLPVSVNAGADGFIMVSIEGGLLVTRRTDDLKPAGGPWWQQIEGYPGLPSLVHEGEKVFLLATAAGKRDLFGSTFLGREAPGPKPTKITMNDSNPPTEGSRSFPSSFPVGDGNWFVSFVDGVTAKKGRARFTILGPDMNQKLTDVMDVTPPDEQVVEARVIGLGGPKALVMSLDAGGNLDASVVTCHYK